MKIVENCKSLILTGLIISSLILTGSLWFDNYQGLYLAISNMPEFITDKLSQEEYSKMYEELILPYKVTVVNPDKNKWISYTSDKMNLDAWNIIKIRLNDIISTEPEFITGKIKEWDDLIDRKSIILEFGGPIEYDIFKLAIPNLPNENRIFNNVDKIALTKSLDGNTIYIMQDNDGEKSLYKILLKGEDEEIETFMQSCENIKADVKYIDFSDLGITKFYNNKTVNVLKNVLFPITNRQDKRDTITKVNVKKYFNTGDSYAINKFVTDIFNNTDFAKFVTTDNGSIYINDDKSSVKIEENGVVEYINKGKVTEEEVSVRSNFNTALDFINKMKVFNNVFLLSAVQENGLYKFEFFTAVDGIPVGFNKPVTNDERAIIEMQVENNSVRYFKGRLIEINILDQKTYISEIAHNILDSLLKNVEKNSTVRISNIFLRYDASNDGSYYPDWVTEYELAPGQSEKGIIKVTKK